MKLSIITVTYNNASGLSKTLKSIKNQTCKEFEYIVVDGASKDNSVDIIKQNETYISKWVSEPDTGIYNAMNKAVRMATGDYCLFINAGDELYSNTTIEELYKIEFNEDFVEGKVEFQDNRRGFSQPAKEITLFYYYKKENNRHQASFIKRNMLLEHPYDEKLRISSDLKFNIECIVKHNCTFRPIDLVIAKYEGGGVSWTVNHQDEIDFIYKELFPDRVMRDYENLLFLYRFPVKQMFPFLKLLGNMGEYAKKILRKR